MSKIEAEAARIIADYADAAYSIAESRSRFGLLRQVDRDFYRAVSETIERMSVAKRASMRGDFDASIGDCMFVKH